MEIDNLVLNKKEFIKYYNKLTLREVAIIFGSSRSKVYMYAKMLGLSKRKAKPSISSKISDEQFIKYYNKLSTKDLAKILDVSRRGVWLKAKQLGLSKRYNKLS